MNIAASWVRRRVFLWMVLRLGMKYSVLIKIQLAATVRSLIYFAVK